MVSFIALSGPPAWLIAVGLRAGWAKAKGQTGENMKDVVAKTGANTGGPEAAGDCLFGWALPWAQPPGQIGLLGAGRMDSARSFRCCPKAGSVLGWLMGFWLFLRKGQIIGVLLRSI